MPSNIDVECTSLSCSDINDSEDNADGIIDLIGPSSPSQITLSYLISTDSSQTPVFNFINPSDEDFKEVQACVSRVNDDCNTDDWEVVVSGGRINSLNLDIGDYYLHFRSIDESGNAGEETTALFEIELITVPMVENITLDFYSTYTESTRSPMISFTEPSWDNVYFLEVCIEEDQNVDSCDQHDWQTISSGDYISGMTLERDKIYTVRFRTYDNSGHYSSNEDTAVTKASWSYSTPPQSAVTAPTTIIINDDMLGSGDSNVIFDLDLDSNSVNDYQYCITDSTCEDEDYIFVDANSVVGITESIETLTDGVYLIFARGELAGVYSDPVSVTFEIDTIAPVFGTVNIYTSKTSNNYTTPGITYSHPDSEIVSVEYCLGGFEEDCSYVSRDIIADPTISKTYTALNLPEGDIYVTAYIEDQFGNVSVGSSYYEVDMTPPSNISSFTLSYYTSTDTSRTPTIHFTEPSDTDYSDTYLCVGTSSSDCSIQNWTAVTGASGNYFSGLSLSTGTTYYVRAVTTDNVGNSPSPTFITFDIN